MFQNESRLLIADNSGAKEILVIRCLGGLGELGGGSNHKTSDIGKLVIATVKKALPHANIKKGQVVKALIITSKKGFARPEGFIKFSKNYAILLKKEDNKPIGTNISVPLLREFGQ